MAGNRANLQVGLQFSADTSQARRQIQALQNEFNKLATSTNLSSGSFGLGEASQAAAELAANLQTAINIDTGRLDLTKFQRNLQAGGRSLQDYGKILSSMGPQGEKAFSNLTNAIMQAEVPLTKANQLVTNLWTSFKQTAKYQFTASLYRGLISGIRNAFSYAKDLNESLNNIRIVTGQSTEQMARFAEQANKAARALSTTTTDYTNAALIYYRQGLSDEEAKARTDVTMKLANVSGVAAETAAEQMTAIWNNFAKGSENLEYFADVITALGATTASSTSEIAEGLEKFAAIGNTVGLSYEYAASALATVTATTRQSADVVGTAFKTLFARIQDLEVGETLEDGTTLGKYSQALAAVGVNIKDANGELKQMDQILNEMAAAWQNISKDQQVALAQTVAGTRQYTQLVALMENWSFMQQNLQTSYDATGTVQKQQEIFAESWEAARDRLKAAAQGIYDSLLDDEFFIKLTNGFGNTLEFINETIKSLGGLKTLLPTLITLFTQLFSKQIVSGMQNMVMRINDMTGATQRWAVEMKQQALQIAEKQLVNQEQSKEDKYTITNQAGVFANNANKEYLAAQKEFINNYNKMTEQQQRQGQLQLDRLNLYRQESVELANQIEEKQKLIDKEDQQNALIMQRIGSNAGSLYGAQVENYYANMDSYNQGQQLLTSGTKEQRLEWVNSILSGEENNSAELQEIATQLKQALTSRSKEMQKSVEDLMHKVIEQLNTDMNSFKTALGFTEEQLQDAAKEPQDLEEGKRLVQEAVENYNTNRAKTNQLSQIAGYINTMNTAASQNQVSEADIENLKEVIETSKLSGSTKKSLEDAIDKMASQNLSEKDFYDQLATKVKGLQEDAETGAKKAAAKIETLTHKQVSTDFSKSNQFYQQQGQGQAGQFLDKKGIDDTRKGMQGLQVETVNTQQVFMSLTSTVTSLWGAFNSLSNVVDVFNNKESTTKQKITAVVGALSTLGFATMSLSRLTGNLNLVRAGGLKIDQRSLLYSRALRLAKVQETASNAAVATSETGIVAGKTAEDAINKKLVVSNGAVTMSMAGLLSVAAPLLIALGAIFAIIAVWKSIDSYLKRDAKAAEDAAEKAKELAEAYDELKKSVEEFKETASNYDEAVDALKDLEVGTEEYKKKVEEANEAARKLLDTNKDLEYTYDAGTGLIKIDSTSLKQEQEKQDMAVIGAHQVANLAQVDANNKALIAQVTEIVRRTNSDYDNDEERKALEELTYQFKLYGDKELALAKVQEGKYGDIISAIDGNDVSSYLTQVQKNQNYELNASKEIAANVLSFNEDYNNQSGGKKNAISILAATTTTEVIKQVVDEEVSQSKIEAESNFNSFYAGNPYNKSYNSAGAQGLAQLIAYTKQANEILKKYNSDKTYTIFNAIGDQARKNGSKIIDQYLQEAISANGDYAKQVIEKTQEIYNTAIDNYNKISNALKNLGISDENTINEFIENWASGQTGNFSNFSQKSLKNFDTEAFASQNWEALGHESAAKLQAILDGVRESQQRQWEEFNNTTVQNMASAAKEAFEKIAKENDEFIYSFIDSQQLVTYFENAFKKGGTAGVKQLQNLLATTKDPVGLMAALENVDWRIADFDDLKKTLRELNISFNESVFKSYFNDMKQAATETYYLTTGLEDLLKTYKEIKDILDKLDFGSVISDEDYEKLIKYNSALKELFVTTLEGKKFLGTSEDLENVQDQTWGELLNTYSKAQNSLEKLQTDKNYNLLSRDENGENKYSAYTIAANIDYNEEAGRIVGLSKEGLERALREVFDEEGNIINEELMKDIEEYAQQLKEMDEDWGDKFASKNFVTSYFDKMADSSDEFNKIWDDFIKQYNGKFKDDLTQYKGLAEEISFTNELVSKSLDIDKYKEYYNYLQKINPALKENEAVSKNIALTNLTVDKGLNNLNSNLESYIEGLTEAVGSAAHQQALDSIRQDLADILSVEVEDLYNIDEAFIAQHQQLIEDASNGSEDALAALEIFAAMAIGELDEDTRKVIENIQQAVLNADPGTIIIPVEADTSGLPDAVKDVLGLEKDINGNWRSQGAWGQRANVKTLQNKATEKNKSGKSKTLKELDDEIDRYHYIRKQLKDIERELERVNKAKERAYGAQHLKYLDQEIEYLKEQAGLQDKYVNEIESYLAKDRGLIAAYGAQFDEFGNISNYNQLFAANFNKYANADDSTNWENFKKALSKYEETLDLWFEQTEEKAEILRQILDKQLEGIQYKVNVKVELDDRELALLEYQLNRLDDAAYDTAEALVNIGSQFEVVEDKIKATTDGIVDTLKTIPGITQAQIDAYLAGDGEALAGLHIEQGQIDMLEDYSDQLLELSNTLKELHDNALQKVSEAFDAWGEKIEDHIAKFQHLNTLIENYQEIIGLLGRSNIGISNEFMREMRNQQITNLQGILNTRTQVKDNLTAQLADARKRASEAVTEAEREDWEQVADDIEQRLKEATESWQQAWIEALQANKEAFEQTMQELVDSFDDYANELKRYDTAQDRYLETYRQAYELSKLTRDIENSINDQDSIRAKKELQKLENKIADIKESGRAISENELGLLQKEYELRLAEIALEDAQNAKSIVRLSRNNEGNWGYTYTADQDKINEAQQSYEDKLYEYMRQVDTMAEEASRTILTLNKEMAEALAALDANAVDYEAKVAEITQFYSDQINYFAEQYGISTDAMVNVARESAAKYKPDVVDIIDSDNSGLQTNFAETVLAIIGDFEDLEDAINGPDGALPKIRQAYTETIAAFEDYQAQNKLTCERAGADVSQMRELMESEFGKIKTQTKETDEATEEMADDMKRYLDQVLENFGDFATRYSNKIKVVSDANADLGKSIVELEKALQNIDASSLDTLKKAADKVDAILQKVKEAAADAEASGSGGGGIEIPPGGNSGGPKSLELIGINENKRMSGRFLFKDENGVFYEGDTLNAYDKNANLRPVRLDAFDSGGYTGDWGENGKLALIHEKELVLNQEDTANILDAVSLIRQMTLGTAQLSNGLGTIGAKFGNFNVNPASMDQHVEIAASFPGVTDRHEIEEAFNNLVNKASQYAFRETRYEPNYI